MREGWLRVTQMAMWATTLLAARTSVATQVTVHDSIEPCPSCIPDARMWYGTQRPRLTCTRRKRLQRTPPSLAEPAGCILRVRSCPAQAQAMTSVIHQRGHLRISSRRRPFASPYSARSLSDALSCRRPLKRHRKFHPADDPVLEAANRSLIGSQVFQSPLVLMIWCVTCVTLLSARMPHAKALARIPSDVRKSTAAQMSVVSLSLMAI